MVFFGLALVPHWPNWSPWNGPWPMPRDEPDVNSTFLRQVWFLIFCTCFCHFCWFYLTFAAVCISPGTVWFWFISTCFLLSSFCPLSDNSNSRLSLLFSRFDVLVQLWVRLDMAMSRRWLRLDVPWRVSWALWVFSSFWPSWHWREVLFGPFTTILYGVQNCINCDPHGSMLLFGVVWRTCGCWWWPGNIKAFDHDDCRNPYLSQMAIGLLGYPLRLWDWEVRRVVCWRLTLCYRFHFWLFQTFFAVSNIPLYRFSLRLLSQFRSHNFCGFGSLSLGLFDWFCSLVGILVVLFGIGNP